MAGGGLLARCGRAYVAAVQRKGSYGAVAVVHHKEQLAASLRQGSDQELPLAGLPPLRLCSHSDDICSVVS